jgi:hypothetical protein
LRRYQLLRDGRLLAELAAGTREYRHSNLPNGIHRYRVLAEDLVGNLSTPSNEVVIEIDGEALAVPVLLRAMPQVDQPALELHWRAGDGVVPPRYRLYASSSAEDPEDPYREIARPQASPWLHVGLAYGQRLYYRIQAEDASGNLSELSPPIEALVRDLRTPASPVITWPAMAPGALDWAQPLYRVCGVAEVGRRIEVRVNSTPMGSAEPQPTLRVSPSMALSTTYISEIALSPDGRQLAWIDGNLQQVMLMSLSDGTPRRLPLNIFSGITFSADGTSVGGIDAFGTAWSAWSEAAGLSETRLLDVTYSAFQLAGNQGWLAAGRHTSLGLWWIRDQQSEPVRIEMEEGSEVRSYVATADGSTVFLLADSGSVYRWNLGDLDARRVALAGRGLQLSADARGAVILLEQDAARTRLLKVDPPQPDPILSLPAEVASFAPAADASGYWVLSGSTLQLYPPAAAAPSEEIELGESLDPSVVLASKTGTLVTAGWFRWFSSLERGAATVLFRCSVSTGLPQSLAMKQVFAVGLQTNSI